MAPAPASRKIPPKLGRERALWDEGHDVVVGVDEVGRGAWAGPISVGAAVLPHDRRVYKVRDSKLLTEVEREAMFDRVAGWCSAWGVGHASQEECDEIGMPAARGRGAGGAIARPGVSPKAVLIAGRWALVGLGNPPRTVRATRRVCRSPPRRSSPRSLATASCGA